MTGREVKSVPKETMSSCLASARKKKLDEGYKNTTDKLKAAVKLYKNLIAQFKTAKLARAGARSLVPVLFPGARD